jgi:hypothetical protein
MPQNNEKLLEKLKKLLALAKSDNPMKRHWPCNAPRN